MAKFEFNLEDFKSRIGKHCFCMVAKDDDTICPCVQFKETGVCICGLFRKVKEDV